MIIHIAVVVLNMLILLLECIASSINANLLVFVIIVLCFVDSPCDFSSKNESVYL